MKFKLEITINPPRFDEVAEANIAEQLRRTARHIDGGRFGAYGEQYPVLDPSGGAVGHWTVERVPGPLEIDELRADLRTLAERLAKLEGRA